MMRGWKKELQSSIEELDEKMVDDLTNEMQNKVLWESATTL